MTLETIELAFEVGRFAFMLGIILFIARIGWSRQLLDNWAWRFSILAFLLLLFGVSIDVIDDYEVTRTLFNWKDSALNTFLEKGVGYFGGFAFMFLAAWSWLPHSDALRSGKRMAEVAQCAAERQRDDLRKQLTQAQKMEAIGALTGGIAHDFNNLLMVIDGYARRASDNTGKQSIIDESLQQVLGATKRATALTKQLLVFSRRQAMEKKVERVAVLIAEMRGLMIHAAGTRINLLFEIEDGETCIETDSNEFSQTLLNLTINARDAMPDSGTITIASKLIDANDDGGGIIEISVTDTGLGMDEATVEHIFEPFFTTKERGKGTGLGLATAYGFMQASGGDIRVASKPGAGTTMSLRFPVSNLPRVETRAEINSVARGCGETILLVEDNEPVLKLIHEALTERGYVVLPAPSGFEALELEMSYDGDIDILLTDIVMPGLSGIEMAQVVRSRRPNARIIFMSGYTDEAKKTGQMPCGATFLQKPVNMIRLAEVIRARLDQREMLEEAEVVRCQV